MGMVRPIVNVEVVHQTAAEAVLGEHALNHMDEQGVLAGLEARVHRLGAEHGGCNGTLSAGETGVAVEYAVGPFFAGELHLIGVDDDYAVAALGVGSVAGLVLAAQNFCHFRAQTAEDLVGGIDYHPSSLYLVFAGRKSFVA